MNCRLDTEIPALSGRYQDWGGLAPLLVWSRGICHSAVVACRPFVLGRPGYRLPCCCCTTVGTGCVCILAQFLPLFTRGGFTNHVPHTIYWRDSHIASCPRIDVCLPSRWGIIVHAVPCADQLGLQAKRSAFRCEEHPGAHLSNAVSCQLWTPQCTLCRYSRCLHGMIHIQLVVSDNPICICNHRPQYITASLGV